MKRAGWVLSAVVLLWVCNKILGEQLNPAEVLIGVWAVLAALQGSDEIGDAWSDWRGPRPEGHPVRKLYDR